MNLAHFEILWQKYPRRLGRKAAVCHFLASVRTLQDWMDIQNALENYLKTREVREGFVQHGKTWFNNWRDYVNYTEQGPPAKEGSVAIPEGKYTDMEKKK